MSGSNPLLSALGLKAPARGLPAAAAPAAAPPRRNDGPAAAPPRREAALGGAPPIDSSIEGAPNRDRIPTRARPADKPLPGDAPVEPKLTPRPGVLDDATLARSLKELPTNPPQRADALADLITQVGDAARRDPLVRTLRDLLAKIPQPFMSPDELKKKIDEGIKSLVETGIKAGIKAILEAATGQKLDEEEEDKDRDTRPSYGPANEQPKAPGETIIKSPKIPFDTPKKVARNSFEFRGLKPSYKASKYFDFTVRTPDWFQPHGRLGAGRVIIGPKAGGTSGDKLRDKRIETTGDVPMSLAAPDAPGDYVMYIWLGSGAESHPVENIKVVP